MTKDEDPVERRYRDYTSSIRAQLPDYISDDVVGAINTHAEQKHVYKHSVGWNDEADCGSATFYFVDDDGKRDEYTLEFDRAEIRMPEAEFDGYICCDGELEPPKKGWVLEWLVHPKRMKRLYRKTLKQWDEREPGMSLANYGLEASLVALDDAKRTAQLIKKLL